MIEILFLQINNSFYVFPQRLINICEKNKLKVILVLNYLEFLHRIKNILLIERFLFIHHILCQYQNKLERLQMLPTSLKYLQ
ncbi:hypothetical protein pb186bvf_002574 [Paramecium bursaria]